MRIVILDGHTLNPGDLSWEQFRSLGECVVYDRTPSDKTVTRSMGAVMLLTNKTALSRNVIGQLPDLTYIGVLATGYNVVDTKAAAERGIVVTNVPEYGTPSVAQMVFAHLLNLCNHVAEHSTRVRQGIWSQSKDFCFWEYPLAELSGRTMGIVGLGRIGSSVATIASAFGMRVLAHDPVITSRSLRGVVIADLKTVFRDSDVVSLHCLLTEHNQGFVNRELLGLMKPGAFLINTSRGPLVNETALADALNSGRIAGAGLDVLAEEPPAAECPLLTASNCYITPHIAWATFEARRRLMSVAFQNAEAFLRGNKVNVVNGV
ncbi:MAG: D-2-hydroxyacid dehydrogenase [Verrucomicrobia bacterium]|nr:D-2-hydroxyacid dehydrogenase [Verrucomicrobiota bacterium]MCG2679185.1 D-2-hydroxyacid dehydrogenase [Kiritimatiellia bacterium]MBU4247937.1 D-2-hydroxyacid dehydrogenase [Verrucomicrobiota bacterium]MBU4289669.1 D-2-hydroxyacid dehydrogenase [Verrucomicrobiota bacterium]MBU4428135.1 D-2-hydroxyacid dehydrogenase [Verrucomicrobiota bacterium]